MTRNLTDHRVSGLNQALIVQSLDEPGAGGANQSYQILIPDSVPLKPGVTVHQLVKFHSGPIVTPEDFNGVTNEAHLVILIDRLRGFQYLRKDDGTFDFNSRGKFACRENAMQLTHLEEALMWAQKRTRDRMASGIEGSHKV